jgi:hypothetical protein
MDLVGDWRNLHNTELHDLYFSPNLISDKIKKGGVSRECGMYRRERHTRLEGKQRQIPLGGSRHRWKDIKMDLK